MPLFTFRIKTRLCLFNHNVTVERHTGVLPICIVDHNTLFTQSIWLWLMNMLRLTNEGQASTTLELQRLKGKERLGGYEHSVFEF